MKPLRPNDAIDRPQGSCLCGMVWIKSDPSKAAARSRATSFATSGVSMDNSTQTELEAAAFRRLVAHLQERTDVQNIDMMNLAGFCRNCLSRWYREAADEKGLDMDDKAARATVYGMDYAEWKAQYQTEATAEQRERYEAIHNHGDK